MNHRPRYPFEGMSLDADGNIVVRRSEDYVEEDPATKVLMADPEPEISPALARIDPDAIAPPHAASSARPHEYVGPGSLDDILAEEDYSSWDNHGRQEVFDLSPRQRRRAWVGISDDR